jgi:translation initiation factor IF-3
MGGGPSASAASPQPRLAVPHAAPVAAVVPRGASAVPKPKAPMPTATKPPSSPKPAAKPKPAGKSQHPLFKNRFKFR